MFAASLYEFLRIFMQNSWCLPTERYIIYDAIASKWKEELQQIIYLYTVVLVYKSRITFSIR